MHILEPVFIWKVYKLLKRRTKTWQEVEVSEASTIKTKQGMQRENKKTLKLYALVNSEVPCSIVQKILTCLSSLKLTWWGSHCLSIGLHMLLVHPLHLLLGRLFLCFWEILDHSSKRTFGRPDTDVGWPWLIVSPVFRADAVIALVGLVHV